MVWFFVLRVFYYFCHFPLQMFELHQFGQARFLVWRSAGGGRFLYLLDAVSGEIRVLCEGSSEAECAAYMRAISGEDAGAAAPVEFGFVLGYFVSQVASYLIVCDGEPLGTVLQSTVYRPAQLQFIPLKMRRASQELTSICGLRRGSFLNRMLSD